MAQLPQCKIAAPEALGSSPTMRRCEVSRGKSQPHLTSPLHRTLLPYMHPNGSAVAMRLYSLWLSSRATLFAGFWAPKELKKHRESPHGRAPPVH